MTKKILIGLAPLLAVAAFAVMPAMASANTTAYGTCETGGIPTSPPCPEGEKNFIAFVNGTSHKVLTEKTFEGGPFILTAPKGTIECKDLKDSGTVENVLGVGNSKETLIFTHCSTSGCPVNTAGAGRGVIVANVTNKVQPGGLTVTVTVTGTITIVSSGPPPTGCPAAGFEIGKVTGSTTGTQAEGSNDLVFNKTTGLKFNGEESELTGNDETFTETGKPVVIN